MEWEVDEGKEAAAVVVGLIEKATNSTKPDLDPRILKSIKSVVRHSDLELRLAVENLMSLMKRDHSQVCPFDCSFDETNLYISCRGFQFYM